MSKSEQQTKLNQTKQSILLVDGHSILFRAFYALGNVANFSSSDGTPTGAVFGFFNICSRYLTELEPSHMCVAFDRHEPTFRHKKYEDYKGTRKPIPEDLLIQVPVVKEILDAMGVQHIELAGYEADDLLGTLAKRYQGLGFEVWLLSGDKDSFQIIDENITVIMPEGRRFGGQATMYDIAKLVDRYGVTPTEFIDVKAIMGDKSDNIPGVDGIGEKGATRLVQTYGSLENIYAHLSELKPGQQKNLKAAREVAILSKELVTIDINVPIDIDPAASIRPDLADTEAYEALKKYDLNALIRKYDLEPAYTDEGLDKLEEFTSIHMTTEQLLDVLTQTTGRATEVSLLQITDNDQLKITDTDIEAIMTSFENPLIVAGFFTVDDSLESLPFSNSDDTERTLIISLKRGELVQIQVDSEQANKVFNALCT
ncbi:MAG TPA: hypothetical protein GX717_02790, partial [Clostridiaceae bacterium]|nr:hypothetical protein [Clostridiaceae bacterium]